MINVKKDLISIVVPIWNVELYLKKCVDSLINQTYKKIEILLVDDGSPDNCSQICDEYAKIDNRIKVYHKKNGGLSDARNYGIIHCKGKYISFVDSDDYVESTYIEKLYKALTETNSDISMCFHYVEYPNKTLVRNGKKQITFDSHEALFDLLYSKNIDTSSWAKLYRRELFKDIRFPVGKLFEDTATTYKLLDASKKIVSINDCLYHYVIRKNSITTGKFNMKKLDLIDVTFEMQNYLLKKYPDFKDAITRRLMYAYFSTYNQYIDSNEKNKEIEKKITSYIIDNRKNVLKDPNLPKRDRLALLSTYFGFTFYKTCWRCYKKITGRN